MAGALGLAVHAAFERPELGLFGIVGAVGLAVALALTRSVLVAPALVLVAAGYAATLIARDAEELDAAAPLVACGLLLVAELAYWSVELADTGRADTGVLLRRLGAILGLGVASLALAAGVLAATAMPLGGGLVWNLVGVAAAAGAVALLAGLAASARR